MISKAMAEDFDIDEVNQDRREARVRRENLIREYTGKIDEIKDESGGKRKELADLENKVRFLDNDIQKRQQEVHRMEDNLKRLLRSLKQDKFELREYRTRIMDLYKEVKTLDADLVDYERKLKKAKIEGK